MSNCNILLRMPINFLLVLAVFFPWHATTAQVRLPALLRDSMVLQRDVPVKVWGWAAANEKIQISFYNRRFKTVADAAGKWLLQLPAMKAGGPYSMAIQASNHITLHNILIGDVWICSGQSNMVHQMSLHRVRYEKEIADADNPAIRHFWIPAQTDLQKPKDDLPAGYWKSVNPRDVLEFSAIAYFFAKKIYAKYHVPIGLVNASVGGTPIEAWTSEEGMKDFASIQDVIRKNKDTASGYNRRRPPFSNMPRLHSEDKGMLNKWYDVGYVPKGWHRIAVPGYWEDQGIKDLDGIVWYRKEFEAPLSMANGPARLFLGRIVDADNVYINGALIGNTTYLYPQRRYAVPKNILHGGKNILVVRVQNNSGKGGFVPDKPYCLFSGKDTVDLTGYWQYKVGEVYLPQRGFGGGAIAPQNQPAALYNAMIAPIVNYACKGFLWYQGESNTGKAGEYESLQTALINDWRNKWHNPNAPFLFVQLPGFMDMNYLPSESQWARFREAQLQTLKVPNTGMAIAIDLGEWNDIHPDRKKEVGDRLALAAEKVAYQEKDIVYSGPLFQSATADGNRITISFTNTGSGLTTSDGEELSYFAIAGADKTFVWAKAKIEGDKVVVWNENISSPMYVRYAWADNPDGANLCNKEGLPASPFRTDQ